MPYLPGASTYQQGGREDQDEEINAEEYGHITYADMTQAEIETDLGPLFAPLQMGTLGVLDNIQVSGRALKFTRLKLSSVRGYVKLKVQNNNVLPLVGGKITGKVKFNSRTIGDFSSSGLNIPPRSSRETKWNFNFNPKSILNTIKNMISQKKVNLRVHGRITGAGVGVNYNYEKTWRW